MKNPTLDDPWGDWTDVLHPTGGTIYIYDDINLCFFTYQWMTIDDIYSNRNGVESQSMFAIKNDASPGFRWRPMEQYCLYCDREATEDCPGRHTDDVIDTTERRFF